MTIENLSANKSFGGWHKQYLHSSSVLNCPMRFAIYLPPQASSEHKVPVLYWLSGLTCTDENFMQKAGALRIAAKLGLAIVAPDTSPRGDEVPDDEAYDLGQGAGFYVNASEAPWDQNYRMFDYVNTELPAIIESTFPVTNQKSIAGHSMGGHGALVSALRHSSQYRSVSAFSPIAHPGDCPWGRKALSAYLGKDRGQWTQYDAVQLLCDQRDCLPALVDQGQDDEFLVEQLKIDVLESVVNNNGLPINIRRHAGYDHSYYFIASFIEDHLTFHAEHLGLL
ncbi:S-formylglutathione hydrolase [Pseudoteredinibacter isoporae]|uniref:S-formylglutathione hydrolase n=1 Tax=Pseudoteredinibacter isoporae TaxID=570281 RepID=A0A7X0JSQ5_9GAMM|nr:S-formylglutathione hydrolase [Pseudoteredinibacter isoporae]MBB6520720.1 S-formylglutathione hydrolase [Pseudoteredinibacter isoporae]NHO86287.1 S-formylglutathione hydrolase [Pseudoteredinibacter isoporae]NIB25262.1 S-formylglutathione hydrolase [Pseudoteredinibacter isoporae]